MGQFYFSKKMNNMNVSIYVMPYYCGCHSGFSC